ncbi:PREDICTED: ewing's tumor-associated antigen 1 [Myotis davidii]|uniref:ewing's tumor-associated antigen 1 n=1 Tax=Myotis davidii TaxID=225400 RepID=UPI000767BB13|nr:PREDICTED: ewing's tumor-associated antigen 1 [Myotis davidii]
MSRRRKLGDSPGPKNTPRQAAVAAAEECSSVVEFLINHGKYETPKRVLKMELLSSTFNSPNDPDGLNDIFWDQNSPMTKQLGKGRKKKIYNTDSDEISHIVNCIAPQDEKPTTDSMLGVWIGETAIPCTPHVAKGKSRAKISCTKLKTQNQEEELMKLAKQFDKNMEELDVIQEQNKRNHDFIQMISEAETLNNYKDNVQMQLLHEIVPEIDNGIIKKPMKENTKVSVVNDQYHSQKPFDQNAEAALNAIFDGSTQKCSGQLSQDLSDALWSTVNTTFGKKSALKEEKIISNETQVTEKLRNKPLTSLSHQIDTPGMTKSYVTSSTKEPEAFNTHTDVFTTGDFEDEWENLLNNEPFVTQNVERSEPFSAPETVQMVDQKDICIFNSKNGKSNSRMNISLDAEFRDSKILDVSSNTHTNELIDARKYRFLPNSNGKPNKLLSTGNKVKFEKPFNKIIQGKTQDGAVASDPTKVKEVIQTKFISNVNTSQKKSTLNTGYSNEQKNKPIFNQSFKTPANIVPFDSVALDIANQTNASNTDSFSDDWNDPSFANEIVKACHQLENTWEDDDVEDDLLYQACDDIERLTQQQDMRKDNKTSESILDINNSSKHGAKNTFTTSKQGSQLVQSTYLNLSDTSAQSSSTGSSQINKSVKMQKGEICGNSPSFIGATTNLTIYSKNSSSLTNNLPVSWSNTGIPVEVNSSKSVLIRSSSLNVNSDHMSREIATCKKKLSSRPLFHGTITDEAQNDLNRTVKFSKYRFTKIKNSQILSQINQNCIPESISDTKITKSLEKNKIPVNPLCGKAVQQQSLMKPESLKLPSKEEEEKNRKYSPEEIQRKRQEALVRRMAKAQASSVQAAPT